jgi:thymidylate kinase
MMSKLLLIRGIPGSGKSTLAREICAGNYCFTRWEADSFYMTIKGYEFNPKLISSAHNWCYHNVIKDLYGNQSVIVSNTFTTNWEMEKYLELKNIFPNLELFVIKVTSQYKTIHDVPEEIMLKMKNRWEDLDPKWGITELLYPDQKNFIDDKFKHIYRY